MSIWTSFTLELLAVRWLWAKDDSTYYTVGNVAIHLRPMQALAGYPMVKKAHFPPWLGALGEVELPRMMTLADKLYLTNLVHFKKVTNSVLCFASFL